MMKRFDYPLVLKQPTEKAVLRRLGHSKKTQVSVDEMQGIRAMMAKAADICYPKAKACVLDITKITQTAVMLEGDIVLTSAKLAKMMTGCTHALVMGATLGKAVVHRINKEIKIGDAVFAVVLDAYASVCVDDVFDFVMQVHKRADERFGNTMTKHRFSAGYGDLAISHQKMLYDILNMKDMDVKITETYMLNPEKSVIAIAGMEKR